MTKVKIMLNSIDAIKVFCNVCNKFDFDIDLVSGRYIIDAKSLMGIFSLSLDKPIDMVIHTDTPNDFLHNIEAYIVKE